MEPVTVLTFNEPEAAVAPQQKLQAAGIPAEIYDECKVQKYWFISKPRACIHIQVDSSHFERALQLLHEWDASEGLLNEAIRCPECGSSRIQYPQFSSNFILPAFGAVLAAIGLIERKFYCEDCQYTWPVKQKLPQQTDPLGWPNKEPHPKHN